MKNFSTRLLKNKKINNLALRSSVLFMSLFILIMIIFSVIITVFFSYRSETMLTNSNIRALGQLATFTDKYIFEEIDALCNTYFKSDSENSYMRKFFGEIENMSVDDMQVMQKNLLEIKEHNAFLENIILYNGKFDSIVSTDDGIVYGASDIRNNLSIQNRFFSYLESISSDFYVPQDDNIMLNNQKQSILYVHYISRDEISSFGKKNVNCVIMAVDIGNINQFIDDIDIPDIQCFAILDSNSKVLIHSDNFPGIDTIEKINQNSYKKLVSLSSGTYRMSYKNTKATYIWMQSGLKDWKYIYIMSSREWYRQLLLIVLSVMCITFIALIATSLLMRRLSRRIYKPFNEVVDKVKYNLYNETHSDDEIELLNNLINDFSQKQIEFDNINQKYSQLRLYRLASSIINGFTNDTQINITEHLATLGIDFSHKKFALFIIEFNENMLKTFSSEQSDFILFDVMDVLYETFNCVVSLAASNILEFVINDDAIDCGDIISTLKKLIPEKSFINIYICDETDNIESISGIHNQSIDLIKYSYIYGFDNIFYTNKLREYEMDNSILDIKSLNSIENALRAGNSSQFYDECNNILSNVKKDCHSVNYAQSAVLRIFSAICRTAKDSGVSITEEDNFKKLMDSSSFDASTIYLFEISDKVFDSIINKISTEKEDKKQTLISDIKEYIEHHITEDISLATVAQHFNISTGYLSKFFKEYTSEAFSKYVVEKKFNYATRMLVENPNMPIADIANSLGYFDTAYFSRQFKSHYGTTPVQYRKMNI